mgnify:CR=1 FL=1|tara:strand:+ start:1426 stop:1758 length:333 start_codon:yes stop_codon:yes gene_type:complete
MKKLHIALGVSDIEASVLDYTQRFNQEPDVVIPGAYALWRTACLNVSIRTTDQNEAGQLRHLGWEADDAADFSSDTDCNGILWERFSAEHQAQEIGELWPEANYSVKSID